MRVVKSPGQLLNPRLQLRRRNLSVFLQHHSEGIPFKAIHRNGSETRILHEIIHAKNAWVNELPIPFHLLTQFRHPPRITQNCLRKKMKRDVFAQNFIVRQPHGHFGIGRNLPS